MAYVQSARSRSFQFKILKAEWTLSGLSLVFRKFNYLIVYPEDVWFHLSPCDQRVQGSILRVENTKRSELESSLNCSFYS